MSAAPIEFVLAALETSTGYKPKKSGRQWMARCPAHNDREPSLGIKESADGTVLLNCYAGCRFENIVEALDLRVSDFFPKQNGQSNKPRSNERKIVATYDYCRGDGSLLFQVVRFEPKDFRKRRPDGKGGWIWNGKGVPLVPYRLPQLIKAIEASETIVVVEGEKDADRLASLGFTSTTNPHGAGKGKWRPELNPHFERARVAIIPDNDPVGMEHALDVAGQLSTVAAEVKIVELPDLPGKADVSDWLDGGGTAAWLRTLLDNAPPFNSEKQAERPVVILPNGGTTITQSASELGRLLGKSRSVFVQGRSIVQIIDGRNGPELIYVKPAQLCSLFENVANLFDVGRKGEPEPSVCSEQTAKLIASSDAFLHALPRLTLILPCPVLMERDGNLIEITGFDEDSGIMALGQPTPNIPLDEAKLALCELVRDFVFQSPSDRARALASILTPAMVFADLLGGRAPIDLSEADQPRTGKGFRNKITSAIYGRKVCTVTQKKGSLGGLEEAFDRALLHGQNFISLDNLRGRVNLPSLELFMTEDMYTARMLRRDGVVDPSKFIIQITSNKAELTEDLSKRTSCVRLLKREDRNFSQYPEGDILDRIRANQTYFLGAVFTVIREWYRAGKPKTNDTRHDSLAWAQRLDWITRNILDAGPLLDNHEEALKRMANPHCNWLRDIALQMKATGNLGRWLRTYQILDILADTEIEIPGVSRDADLEDNQTLSKVYQALGKRLHRFFQDENTFAIENFRIETQQEWDSEKSRDVHSYRFSCL